jgi:hypothetical protein
MLPFDQISRAITVRHVMTPMEAAVTVDVDDTAGAARRRLRPGRFDQAPVVSGDRIVGIVTTQRLRAEKSDAVVPYEPLDAHLVISDDTPVGIALPRLNVEPMLFVVDDTGIAGFVTPSDINKHPVRTHFYLLLSDLEMTLASVARGSLGEAEHAVELLSPTRARRVRERHEVVRRLNVEADTLTAFEFPDLICVAKKSGLFRHFGYESASAWNAHGEKLKGFRDFVMHPTSEVLGAYSLPDLIELESILRGMLIHVIDPSADGEVVAAGSDQDAKS